MELALEGLNKVQVDRWHLLEGGDLRGVLVVVLAPGLDGVPHGLHDDVLDGGE
jgi:hypothetical protein